ncbi:MAG: hypothetical protein EXS18_03380 [Verrucomicrobiae bacterium]|nr:hypothetical protein [Verrucomicrobiae bacterium]
MRNVGSNPVVTNTIPESKPTLLPLKRFLPRSLSLVIAATLFLAGIWLIPHRWCAREGRAWYTGDAALQQKLARGVERWVSTDLSRQHFKTGSHQFNGEWLFGTYMMAGMGFGQTVIEHPEWRTHHIELMGACIERVLTPQVREFDKETWDNDPLETLDSDSDHAAFLGYFNLLLSFHRFLDPNSKYAALNDRITAALVRRLEKSPLLLLRSYPSEIYPVDNCAVIGSIGLYDRATGADHRDLLRRWGNRCRSSYIDAKTHLLYQCINSETGAPADEPRGSGTCLGLYFLSFADPSLSKELFQAARSELGRSLLGFGVVREFPASVHDGVGDIDSGPILFGYGFSATGFSIGACRIHRDAEYFSRLYSTAYLFGAPFDHDGSRDFVTGGPLGNALLFAMLTAQPDLGVTKRNGP